MAVAALVAAVVTVRLNLADRYTVTVAAEGDLRDKVATWWCRGILIFALAVLITSALVRGATDPNPAQPGALPGLTAFLGVLLVVQAALLILLAVTVAILVRRARQAGLYGVASTTANQQRTGGPYLGGHLTTLVAALGFSLGGLLTAVINFGVTRLVGTSEPSGFRLGSAPPDALAVPWPVYAFGAAPIGLLAGTAVAGILLKFRYNRRRDDFTKPVGSAAQAGPAEPQAVPTEPVPAEPVSPVARTYAAATAGARGRAAVGDLDDYAKNRKSIAAAWTVGTIADDAAWAAALAVGGSLLLVLAAEILLAVHAGPAATPLPCPCCGRAPPLWSRFWSSWWPGACSRCCARPTQTRPSARPSACSGTWPPSGHGRCTRLPHPATPNEPCPKWWTGSAC